MNLGPKRAFRIPRIVYHSHHVHVQKGWQNNVKGLSLLKSNSLKRYSGCTDCPKPRNSFNDREKPVSKPVLRKNWNNKK